MQCERGARDGPINCVLVSCARRGHSKLDKSQAKRKVTCDGVTLLEDRSATIWTDCTKDLDAVFLGSWMGGPVASGKLAPRAAWTLLVLKLVLFSTSSASKSKLNRLLDDRKLCSKASTCLDMNGGGQRMCTASRSESNDQRGPSSAHGDFACNYVLSHLQSVLITSRIGSLLRLLLRALRAQAYCGSFFFFPSIISTPLRKRLVCSNRLSISRVFISRRMMM